MSLNIETQILWAQIDGQCPTCATQLMLILPAQARVAMLETTGLKYDIFEELKIGPILFREELVYLRRGKDERYSKGNNRAHQEPPRWLQMVYSPRDIPWRWHKICYSECRRRMDRCSKKKAHYPARRICNRIYECA